MLRGGEALGEAAIFSGRKFLLFRRVIKIRCAGCFMPCVTACRIATWQLGDASAQHCTAGCSEDAVLSLFHLSVCRCCNSTVLDAGGFCCASGLLDDCGVCGGDGSPCALHLLTTAQVICIGTSSAVQWVLIKGWFCYLDVRDLGSDIWRRRFGCLPVPWLICWHLTVPLP